MLDIYVKTHLRRDFTKKVLDIIQMQNTTRHIQHDDRLTFIYKVFFLYSAFDKLCVQVYVHSNFIPHF